MDIEAGKRYKNRQDNEITVLYWDNSYGVWRCSFNDSRTITIHKNGMRFSDGSRNPHDLVSEIREPRTFYATEYCSLDGENRLGVTVYEKDRNDLNTKFMGTEFKQIIKLVEVLE